MKRITTRPAILNFLRKAGKLAGRLEDLGASFLHPLALVFFALEVRFMRKAG